MPGRVPTLLEIFGVLPLEPTVEYVVSRVSGRGAASAVLKARGHRIVATSPIGGESGSEFLRRSTSFIWVISRLDRYLGAPDSSERIFVERKVFVHSARFEDRRDLLIMARIVCASCGVEFQG